jgi:hypothetical protein
VTRPRQARLKAPALAACLAALAGPGVADAACTYDGEAMLTAAAHLSGINQAVVVAPPAPAPAPAPAPSDAEASEAPAVAPPPPPPVADGRCDVVEDGVMATARTLPVECRATLMGRIRARAPWTLAQIKVDGDNFAYLVRPAVGGAKLDTELTMKARAHKTMIATVMSVRLAHPNAATACPKPADVSDILEKY